MRPLGEYPQSSQLVRLLGLGGKHVLDYSGDPSHPRLIQQAADYVHFGGELDVCTPSIAWEGCTPRVPSAGWGNANVGAPIWSDPTAHLLRPPDIGNSDIAYQMTGLWQAPLCSQTFLAWAFALQQRDSWPLQSGRWTACLWTRTRRT